MGGLSVRRIASTALCAGLLAGVTGPAAVAADSGQERVQAASHAPVPGADALLKQVTSLGNLGTVLTPVTNLLNAVLKADNGQLPADQAAQLVQAAKDAIAKVSGAAPATAEATQTPGVKVRADLTSDALAALIKALDALLKAVTSGDASQVVPAVNGVLTGLVNYLAALLLSGGLPAPNLPGLPSLPLPPLPVPAS
ncbi:hypothetical protein J2Z21_003350 [Streptomyces griseochromogenes]|uniref:Secreted protein n=1 Tax=Streptomyces griseochromogenes TaxID=68214 RepID=A0A1B1B8K8_9ACTN|nr:hypothetical protein [Streptomyces griseochromogenes]ANP55155.1 hypothetical protein AVL59_41180 [Streptomyces griseochromogenes]MBP2050411.1 hypothetical protein [Streptomyces griseochromogenes]